MRHAILVSAFGNHKGVVHDVGDWNARRMRRLDEQDADATSIEKCHAVVRLRAQDLAADHVAVEADAALGIADRNAEVGNADNVDHRPSPVSVTERLSAAANPWQELRTVGQTELLRALSAEPVPLPKTSSV